MSSPSPADLPGRLAVRVVVNEQGCWIWQGVTNPKGYVRVKLSGRTYQAHRLAFAALVGPIPADMHIDHACHNQDASCEGGNACHHRRCLNPEHLEAVTSKANTLRSIKTPAGAKSRQRACKRGHPFDDTNTQVIVDDAGRPHRRCRQCQRDRQRGDYWRRKAA